MTMLALSCRRATTGLCRRTMTRLVPSATASDQRHWSSMPPPFQTRHCRWAGASAAGETSRFLQSARFSSQARKDSADNEKEGNSKKSDRSYSTNVAPTTEDEEFEPSVLTSWTERVADAPKAELKRILSSIQDQEKQGGRLKQPSYGVLHQDPATDMDLLCKNYTVGAVASALRDREDVLQQASVLAEEGNWEQLAELLSIYHPKYVLQRRMEKGMGQLQLLDPSLQQPAATSPNAPSSAAAVAQTASPSSSPLDVHGLEVLRKALMRMPRAVTQAHSKRAGVVIALCTVDGVANVLLEKRSKNLRAHADEVCLPGGMVCQIHDPNIVATCLREMQEEIGGLEARNTQVLGVFRCNWGQVHHMVGVAVTPVVCHLGELDLETLEPNPDEVSQVFTIPLSALINKEWWVYRDGVAPIFVGGPHVIWGLTGYILDRFQKDILVPNTSRSRQV